MVGLVLWEIDGKSMTNGYCSGIKHTWQQTCLRWCLVEKDWINIKFGWSGKSEPAGLFSEELSRGVVGREGCLLMVLSHRTSTELIYRLHSAFGVEASGLICAFRAPDAKFGTHEFPSPSSGAGSFDGVARGASVNAPQRQIFLRFCSSCVG